MSRLRTGLWMRTPVIPSFVSIWLFDDHGRVGFKEKNLAALLEAKADPAIVEAEHLPHSFKCGHGLVAQHPRHIGRA